MGSFSVIGLGKLGASMAAAIASRGHQVIGVDVVPGTVDAINAGRAPVEETGLDEMIAANRGMISATMNCAEAVHHSDATFVVTPTPSAPNGSFDITHSGEAFVGIGRALREKDTYHLVVMTSTVLPGATRFGLIPLLEQASGKRAGVDFGVCYSPEFIALGSVIRDFLNPDFTLIGELDQRSGDTLDAIYASVLSNGAPSARMSIENAELTKVAVNTFVTTKITFANMLAELCERLPGGDVDAVTNALGMDSRIGARYLTGALGYGGPCFPRDNKALSYFARAVGSEAPIADATDRANRNLPGMLAGRALNGIENGARVAVLGLSYKPASHVVEESQGLALANAMAAAGARVRAYDPLAHLGLGSALDPRVESVESIAECLRGAQVVLIANPDPLFRDLDPGAFAATERPVRVVDYWRLVPALASDPAIEYMPYGCHGAESAESLLTELWAARHTDLQVVSRAL